MKVAVVAILRDEASDILAWLGWYISLGVDTFFLFDDGSTDGTSNLLRDAAVLHDIRIYAIENTAGPHLERQQAAYITALNGLEDAFDWVGFVDADEYVTLHRHNTLEEFLQTFPEDVGAIGLNWCNYGSNGHVLKPVSPPFFAFTSHYAHEDPINRHVKTFIRPSHWSGEWENVHFLEPHESRYVNPEGEDIEWSEVLGITKTLPAWETARVLHYQLRSMEHFVERARRRVDISLRADNFSSADLNDVQDFRAQDRTSAVLTWVRKAVRQGIARALASFEPAQDTSERSEGPALRLFNVSPMESGPLAAIDGRLRVVETAPEDQHFLALQVGARPDQIFLFLAGNDGHILDCLIDEDSRLLGFFPYDVVASNLPELFALRQNSRATFLTATPAHHGGTVVADRRVVKEWELFRLTPADQDEAARNVLHSPTLAFLAEALATDLDTPTLALLSRRDILQTLRTLPILLSYMPDNDAATVRRALGPLIPYIV